MKFYISQKAGTGPWYVHMDVEREEGTRVSGSGRRNV
jgi:hypothetical protein